MFDEDLDLFFDDFAEEIAYRPGPITNLDAEPVYIKAIFDAEEQTYHDGSVSSIMTLLVKTGECPGVSLNSVFTVRGREYAAYRIGHDEYGIRKIYLTEAQ